MIGSWQFFPVLPPGVILLIGTALLAMTAYGTWLLRQKHVPRRSTVELGLLRCAMVILLVLGLFQPVLSVSRTVTGDPGLIVLVDASASMAAKAGEGTRFDVMRQQLAASPALAAVAKTRPLHWFTFDQRAYPQPDGRLDRVVPAGDRTDVAESLKSAWNHVRLVNASRGIAALPSRALIVSDGQHRGPNDVLAAAQELGLSVDVLSPPVDEQQPDSAAAEIVFVQAARRVLIGSETSFQVRVRPHQAREPLQLVSEEDGVEIDRRELTGLTPGQDQFVIITHRPREAGLKRYQFQLRQDEATASAPYAVNVQAVDDRHDVLILEDSWRWEFKYLRRVLEDDPSFNLTALLSRGENAFVQFGEPDRRVKLGGFPQSRGELDGFDTIVLGDVRPATWPRGLARHIAGAVTEGGKSLVVIAGAHLGDWIDAPELSRLLPVELTRESGMPISGQVEVRVTPAGKGASRFRWQAKASDEPQEIVNGLPALEHVYPVLRKRPAASVLLETVSQQNAHGPLVVIAEQTVGRGRVLFLGTDTLWRWQLHGPITPDGVTLHAAFWQQALRALAPAEQTSRRGQLLLRPERTQYRVDEPVRVAAELMDEEGQTTPILECTVVLPDGRRWPLNLATAAQTFSTQFEPSQPGRYRIESTVRHDGQITAEAAALIEVAARGDERDGSPVDLATLANWAAVTGGHRIDPQSPAGWLPKEQPASSTVVRQVGFNLWHNFTLVLLLSALLAVDWTLRLFRGYV